MRVRAWLLSLSIFFLFLLALESKASLLEPGFYAPSELSSENTPKQLARAIKASGLIRAPGLIGNDGFSCSMFVTSETGYALTALHCVDSYLDKAKRKVRFSRDFALYGGAAYIPFKGDESLPGQIELFGIKKEFSIVHHGFAWVDKLAYGKLQTYNSKEADDFFKNAVNLDEDFAILKFEPQEGSKIPCIPVRADMPKVGDRVWGVGYPSETGREDLPNSDGINLKIGFGRVVGSFEGNSILDFLSQELLQKYFASFQRSKVFISDMDFYKRASGEVVIDAEGKGVGIGFMMADDESFMGQSRVKYRYIPSNAFIVSTEKIIESTRARFGAAKTAEIFNCPTH
jgi:hypothetical protein